MNHSNKKGFSFGLTSGVITTLGLMVGLHSSTHSALAVIGGVFTIAVADAFSDAFGVHVSEEAESQHTPKEIWQATLATFLSKFIFALTFAVPVLLWPLGIAIVINIAWGLLLIGAFSFYLAKKQETNPWQVVGEHLLIAAVVIAITHYVGDLIGKLN